MRRPQGRRYEGEMGREVGVLTEAQGPFEQGESPGQVALAEGQLTNLARGIHEARGVSHHLRNPQPFFSKGPALSECAQLSMALGEVGTGEHGGQEGLAEALVAPCTLKG